MFASRALRSVLGAPSILRSSSTKVLASRVQVTRSFATASATPSKPAPFTPPPTAPKAPSTPSAQSGGEEYTGYKTPTKYTFESTYDVPLKLNTQTGQYAEALFEMIGSKVEDVETEFEILEQAFEEQPEIVSDLRREDLTLAQRQNQVKQLTEITPLSDCTISFLKFLAKQNELNNLPEIIDDYFTLLKSARGEYDVDVIVAHPQDAVAFTSLDTQKRDAIIKKLDLPEGAEVKFNYLFDPTLQKGIILRTESTELDMSLATQISEMEEALEDDMDNVINGAILNRKREEEQKLHA